MASSTVFTICEMEARPLEHFRGHFSLYIFCIQRSKLFPAFASCGKVAAVSFAAIHFTCREQKNL